MKINAYLNFDGNCEEAIGFYAQCLDGKVESLMRFGETPAAEHVPPEYAQRVMHAHLQVGDQSLMASDSTPQCPAKGFQGYSLALNVDSIAQAERVFAALSQGGNVDMPLAQTFWAVRFGALTDKFGVSWLINCEKGA